MLQVEHINCVQTKEVLECAIAATVRFTIRVSMTRSSFCAVQNATNAVFTAKLTQILHNLRFQGLIEGQ